MVLMRGFIRSVLIFDMMNDMEKTKGLGILSLQLDGKSKQRLRDMFPPSYPNVHCDHVTLVC